jgi:hypothetical protein
MAQSRKGVERIGRVEQVLEVSNLPGLDVLRPLDDLRNPPL